MRRASLALLPILLAGCGGAHGPTAASVADCIQRHHGNAVVAADAAADAKGIPGRASGAVELSMVGRTAGALDVGVVLIERSNADAAKAEEGLKHLDPSSFAVPGVDLSMLGRLNAFKSGNAERRGRVIVLWLHSPKQRNPRSTTIVDACL